jgi:toxin ParE1/3/4
MYRLTVRPRAVAQARKQYQWYEEKMVGLGEAFLEALDRCIKRIHAEPLIFQKRHLDIHVAFTDRFPFGVFYVVEGSDVVILAIFHMSANPKQFKRLG